jgi:hypothetical protein
MSLTSHAGTGGTAFFDLNWAQRTEKLRPIIMEGSAINSIPHIMTKKVSVRPIRVTGAKSPRGHHMRTGSVILPIP